jgi:hypothetical protein
MRSPRDDRAQQRVQRVDARQARFEQLILGDLSPSTLLRLRHAVEAGEGRQVLHRGSSS